MRNDIIKLKIKIEAKTEKDFNLILYDVVKNLRRGTITQESYYTGGGYCQVKKIGNSDTRKRLILFRNFEWRDKMILKGWQV